jgi:hypothetical protein
VPLNGDPKEYNKKITSAFVQVIKKPLHVILLGIWANSISTGINLLSVRDIILGTAC